MNEHVNCADCGIEFCLPSPLMQKRREDHGEFYCPNGHSNYFPGKTAKEKRIEELERQVAQSHRMYDAVHDDWRHAYGVGEDLIVALKECPIPGCGWRSRKRITRTGAELGRGIERVRHDLVEHFIRDHAGRAIDAKLLEAG